MPHRYLLDTNVLLRRTYPSSATHATCRMAIELLLTNGHELWITPQNLIEFWNVSTRPTTRNGFGLHPSGVARETALLEQLFRVAPETPGLYPTWRRLVEQHSVSGVQVHDARLVAAMELNDLTHLLTQNVSDFQRYPHVILVEPEVLLTTGEARS